MVKKKPRRVVRGFGSDPQSLSGGIAKVETHLVREEWGKAKAKLEELEERYPKDPEVLTHLSYFYYEIKDFHSYQETLERLIDIAPDNSDALLSLAAAYLKNIRPLLSLQTFRQFLEKFPHHEQVAEVRKNAADLEGKLGDFLAELKLEGEDAEEVGRLHEKTVCQLEQGKYSEARQTAEKLLERRPNFTPALNNISLSWDFEGQRREAIATACRVLEIDPDNFHAHANLTRFYLLDGDEAAARQQAAQIQAKDPNILDFRLKKAEALAYIEDYQGIAALMDEAATSGELDDAPPLLLHLAAVAQMHLGKEKQARKLWKQALKEAPDFELARKNLEDLKCPVGQRHAPWAFSLAHWFNRKVIDDLRALLTNSKGRKVPEEQIGRHLLQQHPEIVSLVPILLKQGDPLARQLALRLSLMAKTPELLAALRDFALSDRGPDSLRLEAAQLAVEAGLIPAGGIQFWSGGQWSEVLLMGIEINDEPTVRHSKAVKKLGQEAIAAMKAKQEEKAEALLLQAMELEPDAPDLSYNLAGVYESQGRNDKSKALIEQIVGQHPDYPLARIALARFHIEDEELEAAAELLKPMLQWRQFNFTAFCQYCEAQIELCVAQDNLDGARSWLQMWEGVGADGANLSHWQNLLKKKSLWQL